MKKAKQYIQVGNAARRAVRPAGRLATRIEGWLVMRVAEAAAVDLGEIRVDRPFADYGLDSAASVALTGELEAWLSRRLPPTLVWEYPTIAALTQHLADADRAAVEIDAEPRWRAARNARATAARPVAQRSATAG